jgi:hypothetical protein
MHVKVFSRMRRLALRRDRSRKISSVRMIDPRKESAFCLLGFSGVAFFLAFGGFEGGGCGRSRPIPESAEISPSSTRTGPAMEEDQPKALRFRGRRAFGRSAGRVHFWQLRQPRFASSSRCSAADDDAASAANWFRVWPSADWWSASRRANSAAGRHAGLAGAVAFASSLLARTVVSST